jgi:glucan phosphorylase
VTPEALPWLFEVDMPTAMFNSSVAYFSMEICLEQAIPTYSGGLGVLAGDTRKSSSSGSTSSSR